MMVVLKGPWRQVSVMKSKLATLVYGKPMIFSKDPHA